MPTLGGPWKKEASSFEGRGSVQEALRKIARRLDELGIPYAIVGGMALFLHGYRRFTEDVNLLVRPENLKRIHTNLRGHGYVPAFERSKQLVDSELRVRIKLLTTGSFPGDGKPKPIAFPDPRDAVEERQGVKVLRPERLIELKLASGLSAPHRQKDLVDIQELIQAAGLPKDTVERLDPSVRERFLELWDLANTPQIGPDADVFDP